MTYLAVALLALAFYGIRRCTATYDLMKDQRDCERPDPPPPQRYIPIYTDNAEPTDYRPAPDNYHDIEEPRE